MEAEIQKALIALTVALVSWFIKDILFKRKKYKTNLIIAEHKNRLEEIWSPLYFYTGLILMDSPSCQDKWKHPGVSEIQSILKKSAHIIPDKHYRVLIKILEGRTKQNTSILKTNDYMETRKFIYRQIEISNYIVFKKTIDINPTTAASSLPNVSNILRTLNSLAINLLSWILIVAVLFLLIYSYVYSKYWVLVIFLVIWAIIFFRDFYLRFQKEKILRKNI